MDSASPKENLIFLGILILIFVCGSIIGASFMHKYDKSKFEDAQVIGKIDTLIFNSLPRDSLRVKIVAKGDSLIYLHCERLMGKKYWKHYHVIYDPLKK